MSDVTPPAAPSPASIVDLQAEVVAAREELVASIAELKSQTAPKALAERGGRKVTGRFVAAVGGQVLPPDRVIDVTAEVESEVLLIEEDGGMIVVGARFLKFGHRRIGPGDIGGMVLAVV